MINKPLPCLTSLDIRMWTEKKCSACGNEKIMHLINKENAHTKIENELNLLSFIYYIHIKSRNYIHISIQK